MVEGERAVRAGGLDARGVGVGGASGEVGRVRVGRVGGVRVGSGEGERKASGESVQPDENEWSGGDREGEQSEWGE